LPVYFLFFSLILPADYGIKNSKYNNTR
jgi:hypothetical protein